MQFIKLMPAVLSAAFIVTRIDGLAPARLPSIRNVPTPTPKAKWQGSYNRNRVLKSSVASSIDIPSIESQRSLNRIQSNIVKAMMVTYVASMCVALPVTLFPVFLLYRANIIDRVRKEKWSLKVGQFCSRWLMRVFPFASKRVLVDADDERLKNPEPSIWVCNHISMLDLFFVLALDKRMRGRNRRPIKILYWKGLEANPITGLLCKMCGFIPVDSTSSFSTTQFHYFENSQWLFWLPFQQNE
mmetsp:Transcript_3821/g.9758  ORF Transcript_3821/g.9758 Transcript_3821/m.9758 type:complete len:243 (+) Transcript_3821:259-987(+)